MVVGEKKGGLKDRRRKGEVTEGSIEGGGGYIAIEVGSNMEEGEQGMDKDLRIRVDISTVVGVDKAWGWAEGILYEL